MKCRLSASMMCFDYAIGVGAEGKPSSQCALTPTCGVLRERQKARGPGECAEPRQ
jgi:hypothetical protein